MKKIKVLHTDWSSVWGSSEVRIISELEMFRNIGLEVSFVCREDSLLLPKADAMGFKDFILSCES